MFKGEREDPCISVAKAEAVVDYFRRIQGTGKMLNAGKTVETHVCWSPPPPPNWFKINVDAAINMEDHLVGLVIVIRDANKNFVAATVKNTKLHSGVTFAEAEAMNWGLRVAYDAGLANIIIESDSLEAVDFVNNRKSSRTEIQWLISEVQNG